MTEIEKNEIYQIYQPKIIAYFMSHLQNRDDAEDLCSTVFLKVYEKLDCYELGKSAFSTWIYTIAKNTLTDFYRTKKVHSELDASIPDNSDFTEAVANEEMLEILATALDTLEERERDLILLHYYKKQTLGKIAERMGISYSYAKVIHNKALSKLQKQMKI